LLSSGVAPWWQYASARRPKQKTKPVDAQDLLAWYDAHRGRCHGGRGRTAADPYHVWLSEIMLQQTTVQAVGAYYVKFLKAWPTVGALAARRRTRC